LHLPKKDDPKKEEPTQQTIAIPESEEEDGSDVARGLRAKFQRKSTTKSPSSGESSEGSGLSVSSEADDKVSGGPENF
jgi:hypothetical protein